METPTLVETFVNHGRYLRGWSPHTVRTYTQVLSRFRVEQVSKQSPHEYILSLQARGLTPGGINIHLRTVNSFLTYYMRKATPRSVIEFDCYVRRRRSFLSSLTAISNDS